MVQLEQLDVLATALDVNSIKLANRNINVTTRSIGPRTLIRPQMPYLTKQPCTLALCSMALARSVAMLDDLKSSLYELLLLLHLLLETLIAELYMFVAVDVKPVGEQLLVRAFEPVQGGEA